MPAKPAADEKTKMKEQKTTAAAIKPAISKCFAEIKNQAKDDKKLSSVIPVQEKKMAILVKKLSAGKAEKQDFDLFEKMAQEVVKNFAKIKKEMAKDVEKIIIRLTKEVDAKSKKLKQMMN